MISKDIWIDISIEMRELSKAIRLEDVNTISLKITILMNYMLTICKSYGCDFEKAWKRWLLKAMNKTYF